MDQAVVIAREDRPGDKRLVGYITGSADPVEVRQKLAQRLPEYMVPVAVVVIDALPLTINGKLDTRALPAPEYSTGNYRAPATPTEEILAGIYAQVLALERVSVDDSFFDLGGDSLAVMRLVAAVNNSLGADLAVRTVFEAPTVAQLAPRIGAGGVGLRRCGRWSARRWCRCRLPSRGCGFWSSCRGRLRFTTWRWRCGWAGHLMLARWGGVG
ncbi:phosphopantetheine attachment site family protein [Mycobacterium xenopi 3993]|nr:phosphopantetheine attachment site family protein [Mycobacterium xenopi 3993]